VVLIDSCEDGLQAAASIATHQPDLVLLDIQMPEMDGFGVLKTLAAQACPLPMFIFVTAYNQYAIRAFDANALDYLLKPYDDARFYRSLEKARQALRTSRTQEQAAQLQNLLKMLPTAAQEKPMAYLKKLAIRQQGKILLVPVEEIDYVESESNFVKVHTATGMKIASYTCKQLEELLDPKKFIRIHKSYLVNVTRVESVEPHFHGDYLLSLKSGTRLKLSRNYKDKLELILNQYE
jgi:two-component system, LytTR family, response regulator